MVKRQASGKKVSNSLTQRQFLTEITKKNLTKVSIRTYRSYGANILIDVFFATNMALHTELNNSNSLKHFSFFNNIG